MSTNANSPHNLDLLLNAISENEPSTDSSSSSSPNMHAIQSLLAASQQLASPTTAQPQDIPQQGPPPDEDEDEEPPSASSTAHENGDDEMTIGKRKRDDQPPDESRNKLRRNNSTTPLSHPPLSHPISVPTPAPPPTLRVQSQPAAMTTVMCFHAAVAQKSYGSEKRFLCPPPLVQIESPVLAMRNQQLSMSIITDTHERTADQKATLDDNLKANFKYLHVGGGSVASTKSKSFYLALEITDPNARPPLSTPRLIQSDSSDGAPMPLPPLVPAPRPWAAFDSAPVTIISKPSKKTAKTRNIASCILAGGPVSLFNRINSQTVRTKYMTVEQGELAASNMSWSSFNVHVTRPVLDPSSSSSSSSAAALEQGPRLGPHPVQYGSEVILTDTITGVSSPPLWVRKVDKGIVIMEPGGPVSQMQKIALQRSTPPSEIGGRMYLSAGRQIFTSDTSASMEGKNGGPVGGGAVAPHTLQYQAPKTRIEIRGEERVAVEIDEVDDYLCWTIVGISKFQYTFFDARSASPSIPPNPITPFPTLISQPVYRPATHTMELSVSHFAGSGLDVWLGNIGPLSQRVYHSAVEDANTHNSHTIVVVDLPALAEIVGVVQGTGVGSGKGKGKEREGYAATTQAATMDGVPPVNVGLLPILLVRASDGVGYHSGRSVACENIFAGVVGAGGGGEAWMEAANAVNGVEGGIAGWSLRIV